ncbi:phosphatidylglycerol lysyltransferase domain-containing protein [Litoreibacter roseus]|uniref:phosphatidylglycerol lysyltransferase domain-containing protein n=1 Tax=Litoreibacter roseus TaxID=2601869 RepID=UPI00135B2267|nr:phosphatidylglycerol lysyltransferase domain-containing protein [Litoreibacter roseus]
MSALACAGLFYLLRDRIDLLDPDAIRSILSEFTLFEWGAASVLTAISFWAIGQYDAAMSAHLSLSVRRQDAESAGWRATAISQTLGFGLITGALVRWHVLGRKAGLTLWDASRLTAAVSIMFLVGWVVVISGTALVTVAIPAPYKFAAALAILCFCGILALSIWALPPWSSRLPSVRVLLKSVGLTVLDTAPAALIIFLFLPDGYAPFTVIYLAFLAAYVAGVMSGIPGGAGAFELCVLALVPHSNGDALIASLLGYRLTYYLGPAAIAGTSLVFVRPARRRAAQSVTLHKAACLPPEATLTQLNMFKVHQPRGSQLHVLRHITTNSHIVLGDPFGKRTDADRRQETLAHLQRDASHAGRGLCLYKCSAGVAQSARELGLAVHQIGQDAVVSPADFAVDGSDRRTLRRKLKKAQKSGVAVRALHFDDWVDLKRIDAQWQHRNGAAMGFSMGTFERTLVRRQAVFTASHNGRICGFITFHTSGNRWVLDLMRSDATCPDGTMHALIYDALKVAREEDVGSVSLSTVPLSGIIAPCTLTEHLLSRRFDSSRYAQGLFQFKRSFSPNWEPVYVVGSSYTSLAISAIEISRRVKHPIRAKTNLLHEHYGYYEFAA